MERIAIVYLFAACCCIGAMSQLRKSYQIENGTGLLPTFIFCFCSATVAAVMGALLGDGLKLEPYSFVFACCYAAASMVTTALCICGTAFGNTAILIMYATLGSLVLPSIYGILLLPGENKLTILKVLGYVMALICLLLNLTGSNKNEGSSKLFKIFCILAFFTNGSALIIYNLENRYCSSYSYYSFIAEYMIISAAALALIMLIMFMRNKDKFVTEGKKIVCKKNMVIIFLYAVLFFSSDLLNLRCAGVLPLIIQAPVSFCVPVVVVAILDYMIYGEKLNKKNLVQIIFAIACCLCFVLE